MDVIAEKIDGKEGQVLYSSVDRKHADRKVTLDESTAKPCNFQTIAEKNN